jgi:dual specificity protein kinase YAK1
MNRNTNESFAMKIIKNLPAYNKQAEVEKQILLQLKKFDVNDEFHILRPIECFVHNEHHCIVTELLGIDLYAVLKQNSFRGFPLNMISRVCIFNFVS